MWVDRIYKMPRRWRWGKAVEGHRSPRRCRECLRSRIARSVLECASPLALSDGAENSTQKRKGARNFFPNLCALALKLARNQKRRCTRTQSRRCAKFEDAGQARQRLDCGGFSAAFGWGEEFNAKAQRKVIPFLTTKERSNKGGQLCSLVTLLFNHLRAAPCRDE